MKEHLRPHDLTSQPILMRDFSFMDVGKSTCHWQVDNPAFAESMQGVETSALVAIAGDVQRQRMTDLSGMPLYDSHGHSVSNEIQNAEAYQRQFFDLARALHYYSDGSYVRIEDSEFDITQGLVGEALFYAVARKVNAPITITKMVEDHGGKGRDIEILTDKGSRYLDITTIRNEERRKGKFAPTRDASVFYIPLRDMSPRNPDMTRIIQFGVNDLFHTNIADSPEEGLHAIAYGKINYNDITFASLSKKFNLQEKDPAKILFSNMLEFASNYLMYHYSEAWGYKEFSSEQKAEYDRVMYPIQFLRQFAQQ